MRLAYKHEIETEHTFFFDTAFYVYSTIKGKKITRGFSRFKINFISLMRIQKYYVLRLILRNLDEYSMTHKKYNQSLCQRRVVLTIYQVQENHFAVTHSLFSTRTFHFISFNVMRYVSYA